MHKKLTLESKVCPACDRSFNWRKKWQHSWSGVRYCSKRCRRQKLLNSDTDQTTNKPDKG